MEQVTSSEILNEIKLLRSEITQVIREINENEKLLLDLLKKNNHDTEFIQKAIVEDKSAEQQTKDFLINVAANLVGNTIKTPTLFNTENLIK